MTCEGHMLQQTTNKVVTDLVYGYIAKESRLLSMEIPTDIIDVCLFFYKMMQEEEIELEVHSHRGDSYGPPENMLGDKPLGYYCSTFGTIKDDWIVFQSQDNDSLFVPTRVEIRVDLNNCAINQFNILCGNAAKQEWVRCNQNTLKSAATNKLQSFELDTISNMEAIESNHYQQYKLEILNNKGNPHYIEGCVCLNCMDYDYKLQNINDYQRD